MEQKDKFRLMAAQKYATDSCKEVFSEYPNGGNVKVDTLREIIESCVTVGFMFGINQIPEKFYHDGTNTNSSRDII